MLSFVIWGRCLFSLEFRPPIYGPTSSIWTMAVSPLPEPWAKCSKELQEPCLFDVSTSSSGLSGVYTKEMVSECSGYLAQGIVPLCWSIGTKGSVNQRWRRVEPLAIGSYSSEICLWLMTATCQGQGKKNHLENTLNIMKQTFCESGGGWGWKERLHKVDFP